MPAGPKQATPPDRTALLEQDQILARAQRLRQATDAGHVTEDVSNGANAAACDTGRTAAIDTGAAPRTLDVMM